MSREGSRHEAIYARVGELLESVSASSEGLRAHPANDDLDDGEDGLFRWDERRWRDEDVDTLERRVVGEEGEALQGKERDAFRVTSRYSFREDLPSAPSLVTAAAREESMGHTRMERQAEDELEVMKNTQRVRQSELFFNLGSPYDDHVIMAVYLLEAEPTMNPYGNDNTLESYREFLLRKEENFKQGRETGDLDTLEHLRQERETWSLLWLLHTSRLNDSGGGRGENLEVCPQGALAQAYLAEEGPEALQKWNVVTRWFHYSAECDNYGELFQQTGRNGPYLPETTQLQVPRLDPDATSHGVRLHPHDENDTLRLLKQLWKLVRQGAFYDEYDEYDAWSEQVEALCREFGQLWRVSAYTGGKPYRFKEKDGTREEKREGNAYRSVWKAMCKKAAEKLLQESKALSQESDHTRKEIAQYEGLIYAVLSGDSNLVLEFPQCTGWRNTIWARFRCLFQAKVDQICVQKHSQLLGDFHHVPGPRESKYEKELDNCAQRALQTTEGVILEKANRQVDEREQDFFIILRSLIEGTFPELLSDGDGSLVVQVCDKDWETFCDRVVEELLSQSTQVEIPDASLWEGKSLMYGAQLLRFIAHISIYMVNSTTERSVVTNCAPVNYDAVCAVVLAYLRYLLGNHEFIAQRYAVIPLFYHTFHERPEVPLAVQAAMMEAASLSDVETRVLMLREWTPMEPMFLCKAVREALRSVRRQLCRASEEDRKPCAVLSRAIEYLGEAETVQCGMRLMRTWSWFDVFRQSLNDDETAEVLVEGAQLESLVQGCVILRDLVNELFANPSVDLAYQVQQFCDHLTICVEEYQRDAGSQGESQLHLSPLPKSNVIHEVKSWKAYFDAAEAIQEWQGFLKEVLALKLPQNRGKAPENLSSIISDRALAASDQIQFVLEFEGGWLVDPETTESMEVQDPILDQDEETSQEILRRTSSLEESPGSLRSKCIAYLIKAHTDILIQAAQELENLFTDASRDLVELYRRALTPSDAIASERFHLLKCLDKEALEAFLLEMQRIGVKILQFQPSVFPE